MRTYPLDLLRQTAELRPAGYLEAVLARATVIGDTVQITEADFLWLRDKFQAPAAPAAWPTWVRAVARLKTPTDAGVGDTVARVIGPVGGEAFKAWFKRQFGRDCGCAQRQAQLNQTYPYAPGLTAGISEHG